MQRLTWTSLLLVVVLAMLAGGCVTRTTTRQKRLAGTQYDADGQVVTRKLIWIWQPEFWEP
jgi:hypothetical protein